MERKRNGNGTTNRGLSFRVSGFGLLSAFGFRPSGLGHPVPCVKGLRTSRFPAMLRPQHPDPQRCRAWFGAESQ